MPRPLRPLIAGGIYHVYDRGNRRQAVFLDDEDRSSYLSLLRVIAADRGWSVLAWCLMDNHYHLLLRTRDPDLGDGMRELNGGFAQRFNRRHALDGHLWQGRYGAKLVTDEAHLHAELRYIAMNPVEAHIVDLPEDHEWSSYGIAIHGRASPLLDREALFRLLSPFDASAITAYRRLVTPRDVCAYAQRGVRPLVCGVLHTLEALASEERLSVVALLAGGEASRDEAMRALGMSQSQMTRTAASLAAVGLVEVVARGRQRRYRLVPEALEELELAIRALREGGGGGRQ